MSSPSSLISQFLHVADIKTFQALLIVRRSIGKKICKHCRTRICAHMLGVALMLGSLERERLYMNPTHFSQARIRFELLNGYIADGNEEAFREFTRFNFSEFREIFIRIEHRLRRSKNHKYPIAPLYRLAICLRYLGHGRAFRTLGHEFRLGRSTIAAIVYEVCDAITTEFWHEVFPMPTRQTWSESAEGFQRLWHYPRGVAAIDGKHFRCIAPRNSGSAFYNYKGTFSIVLLLVVDSNYKILALDCGGKGRISDSGLFRTSPIKDCLELSRRFFPPPEPLFEHGIVEYHVLADGGFPHLPWMQRPYQQAEAFRDPRKSHFNECFSAARRVVESVFGIISSRFRVFQSPLCGTPENMKKIIMTACVLHNLLTKRYGEDVMRMYPNQRLYDDGTRHSRANRQTSHDAQEQRERLTSFFAQRDRL